MAALPMNVKTYLIASAATDHKHMLLEQKGNFQASGNYIRGVSITSTDEPSAASARAIDKVLMLPEPPNNTGN